MSTLRRTIIGLPVILMAMVWAWFGAATLRSDNLEAEWFSLLGETNLPVSGDLGWPLSSPYLVTVLNYLGLPLSARSELGGAVLDRAREAGVVASLRRPLNPDAWLLRAELEKLDAKNQEALQYALTAGALGRHQPKYLDRLLPLYIRLGEQDRAIDAGVALLASTPVARDRVYSQLIWSGVPAGVLVDEFAGDVLQVADSDYWESTMQFAVRSGHVELAEALWQVAPYREGLLSAAAWPEALARAGDDARISRLINDTGGPVISAAGESELSFNSAGPETLCWRVWPHRDVQAEVLDASVLRLDFPGGSNTAYSQTSCLIGVEPNARGRSLVIAGDWRGENLTTREGIAIEIRDVRGPEHLLRRTERRFGTWDWEPILLEFSVPDDASVLLLRVVRRKTDNLDNAFTGSVSFRDFAVQPASEEISGEAL